MLLLHLKFRCHHQVDGKPRLQVVLLRVRVGLMVDQEVVVSRGIRVGWSHDGGLLDSGCWSNRPKSHQHLVWE